MTQQVALVTGTSSGIGRAAALALHEAGFLVYATARRPEALADLAARGLRTLRLDVTDDASMVAAVGAVEAEHGAVDVLVNNAGLGPLGAIEDVPPETWRRLFDTNVFGMARLAQLVLPAMRARGAGRIVNVGSMGGEFTTALYGAYHASKYAVEALSDALRVEVAPFGVDVVLIQPGPVKTPMAQAAAEPEVAPGSAYRPALEHVSATATAAIASGRGMLEPEAVARVVVRAATARRPRDRYKVGPVARLLPFLRRWLPLRTWDALQRRQGGLDRLPAAAPS